MEFIRKKKKGQDQKVRRSWFTEEGYRIIWRCEYRGVQIPARYQACVRTLIPYSDGELRPGWDFVNRERRLIKTLKAAQEECEQHYRLWTKATEVTGIRALKELFGGHIPIGFPAWVETKLNRRIYDILSDSRPVRQRADYEEEECEAAPDDLIRTSDSSASPTEVMPSAPTLASSAEEKGHKRLKSASKASSRKTTTDSTDPSVAPLATARGKGRKRPAAKRTRKSSKRTGKRAASTTDSLLTDAKHSRNSRKSKSESSKN